MQKACCRGERWGWASTLQSSTERHTLQTSTRPPLPTSFMVSARCSSSEERCSQPAVCWIASWTSLLYLRTVSNTVLSGAVTERKGNWTLSQTMGIIFSFTFPLDPPQIEPVCLFTWARCEENGCQHCSQSTGTHSDRWWRPHP